MRWEALFADLEAQADALATAERAAEIDERTRIEAGAIRFAERLPHAVGTVLALRLPGLLLRGRLERVGPDWLLVADDGGEVVVPTLQVLAVRGASRFVADSSRQLVASRLTVRHACRGIARDRSPVRVHLVDGALVDGTIDRVGADYLEVAVHAPGEYRRATEVRDVELVPLAGVSAIRRRM